MLEGGNPSLLAFSKGKRTLGNPPDNSMDDVVAMSPLVISKSQIRPGGARRANLNDKR